MKFIDLDELDHKIKMIHKPTPMMVLAIIMEMKSNL